MGKWKMIRRTQQVETIFDFPFFASHPLPPPPDFTPRPRLARSTASRSERPDGRPHLRGRTATAQGPAPAKRTSTRHAPQTATRPADPGERTDKPEPSRTNGELFHFSRRGENLENQPSGKLSNCRPNRQKRKTPKSASKNEIPNLPRNLDRSRSATGNPNRSIIHLKPTPP